MDQLIQLHHTPICSGQGAAEATGSSAAGEPPVAVAGEDDGRNNGWALGGVEFHECPREAMRAIAAALRETGVVYAHDDDDRGRYGKLLCARFAGAAGVRRIIRSYLAATDDAPSSSSSAASAGGGSGRGEAGHGGGAPVDDAVLESLSAAVFFEIQVFSSSASFIHSRNLYFRLYLYLSVKV